MSSTDSDSKSVKNRVIIRNPDGTYSHLYKDGEKDSIYDKKEKLDEELCQNQRNIDNLSLSDDELQYILDHADQFDYCNLINQIINLFRTYRYVFIFCLVIEFLIMSSIMFRTFQNKEDIITSMVGLYKDINAREASMFFNCVYIAFLIANSIYYPLGFYSIAKKQVKLMKYFANLSAYSALGIIFIIYINVYFLFVFILRLVLYGFAKFIINLLVSILLLPNRNNNNQNVEGGVYGTILNSNNL